MDIEIKQLINRLNYPETDIRITAANALAEMGDDALAPLLGVLKNSLDENARAAAAYALGSLRHEDAVPTLIDALEIGAYDHPTKVTYHAAVALERIATPEALAAVDFWRDIAE